MLYIRLILRITCVKTKTAHTYWCASFETMFRIRVFVSFVHTFFLISYCFMAKKGKNPSAHTNKKCEKFRYEQPQQRLLKTIRMAKNKRQHINKKAR